MPAIPSGLVLILVLTVGIHALKTTSTQPLSRSSLHALSATTSDNQRESNQPLWPCNDALDKRILNIALPAILNFAILPLVGAADTLFVGRMGNSLALAGQGAANQIFNSAFWVLSFFPSVVTPLVARAHAAGDGDALRARVGEAMLFGGIMGILGTYVLVTMPERAISVVLPTAAKAREYAVPYLSIRGLTFLPAIISTICFAAFRGTLDVLTPLRIAVIANVVNIVLDPFFIFRLNKGVAGAAIATCISEIVSVILYIKGMASRNMVRIKDVFALPKWESIKPLVVGGLAVQLRGIGLNIAFLAVTKTTQALDTTGVSAAAHAITIQLWQLGGIFLLAFSSVASVLVPNELNRAGVDRVTGLHNAKATADRLLRWGIVLGFGLSIVQILALPMLKIFSPLPDVQDAARLPSVIGAALQIINGVVFIGEGIQQGNQGFNSLAVVTIIASLGMVTSLKLFGSSLTGVWGSFAAFNLIRLAGVLRHHYISGPLAPAKILAASVSANSMSQ
jgi:MATE family multidrug resistance protein